MKIVSLQIERSQQERVFCGTLDYIDEGLAGSLLWTVDASPLKINVAFVQGSDENWDELARKHAGYLSDQLILEIARTRGLPALVTPPMYSV